VSAARAAILAVGVALLWPAANASAAPGADVGASSATDAILGTSGRGYVQAVGGFLHFFDDQWFFVSTAELGAEIPLSPRLVGSVVAPLILVERDGDVLAGWGNLGAAIRYHDSRRAGDERWLSAIEAYVSAPTATDRGDAGFAAQSAAAMHTGMDFGEFYPGATTGRLTGMLRWQGPRWSVLGAAGYRFNFLTYDQGETEYLEILVAVIDADYRLTERWTVGGGLQTTSSVLEKRWADGDLFRHILHLDASRSAGRWSAKASLLIPLDFVLRDDQSPMVAIEISRQFGR